jgi:hypothetical protein
MTKSILFVLVAGIVTAAGVSVGSSLATAADLPLPVRAHATRSCGPCGCLHVTWQYHRGLETTYGSGFDPRNYDSAEPHYYFGPVRAYPRYWVAAD